MLYQGGKFVTGKFIKRLVILKNRFGSWKERVTFYIDT